MPAWMIPVAEIAAVILIALLLRFFVFTLIYVKGSSMRETLHDGDFLLARRYNARRRPQRLDVVICRYPKRKERFVKRVIGMPGETVSIMDGQVLINGEPLKQEFLLREAPHSRMKEVMLGPDEYFVLGDNRRSSRDSRAVGPLKEDMLRAKVYYVFGKVR